MRVLVIDDEELVANTWVMILQQAGHEAAAAYDGLTALKLVKSFQPEVVLSDVVMPKMNGIEVCSRIQADHPKCRIFLFSGQAATSGLVEDARSKGYTWEVLAKPVDPEEFLSKLASIEPLYT